MKNRSLFLLQLIGVSVAISITACKNKTREVEEVALTVIRPSQVYEADKVAEFIRAFGAENAITAEYYIKKSNKALDTDPQQAIWNLKRAITLHPKQEYYEKLGELLIKTGNYKEGKQLYSMVTEKQYIKNEQDKYESRYVFDKPSEDIYYNYLLCSVLSFENWFPAYLVFEARSKGYDVNKLKNRLLSDERYHYDTAGMEFKRIMLAFLSDEEVETYCDQPENFQKFLTHIDDTLSMFTIDQQSVSNFNYSGFSQELGEDSYSFQFLEMNFLKEKRENPDTWLVYNCNHTTRLNDQVYVVEYSLDTSAIACPKAMRHVTHILATYTPEGKVIDTKPVAWQSGTELASMSYDNGKITINSYKRTWKNEYNKWHFDNDIVRTEATGQSGFVISPDGKITEQAPL